MALHPHKDFWKKRHNQEYIAYSQQLFYKNAVEANLLHGELNDIEAIIQRAYCYYCRYIYDYRTLTIYSKTMEWVGEQS